MGTGSPLDIELPMLDYRSALSVSHTLDGLLLSMLCRPVSSCSHVRDFTSGVFPAIQPLHLSMGCTFLAFSTHAPAPARCRERQSMTHRLQGLSPDSGPLRSAESLSAADARSPLVFSAPSGLAPKALEMPSTPPPLVIFAAGATCPPGQSIFSVSIGYRYVRLSLV